MLLGTVRVKRRMMVTGTDRRTKHTLIALGSGELYPKEARSDTLEMVLSGIFISYDVSSLLGPTACTSCHSASFR